MDGFFFGIPAGKWMVKTKIDGKWMVRMLFRN